ncbi:hypothetical protein BayCH28_05430 [Mycolicibacterium sp. CH28]|uniref:hypothetical protein n=1 Tax=Mycolicibacterium sp. CH28 TaxID=2512237 RepID=UPI001080121E|nr:hypothetical protein [Mycolicibacterium sp. CH28]TGD90021.1 hypothetical protein BayCH28_05430 [Mycolicibacterium sp. CH28]
MAATDQRLTLSELGGERGWQRRETDRADVYTRGKIRVRVIWQGDAAISGASYFEDDVYETYTRELDKVRTWLSR